MTLSGGGPDHGAGGKMLPRRPKPNIAGSIAALSRSTATGASDVDLAPLRLVADAFLLGRRRIVEPFVD